MERKGIAAELHKAARKNFPRRYVTIKGMNDLFQADLVEMRPYSSANKGNNYILTVIDTFSKKGWAKPLKTKKGEEVARNLQSIFEDLKQTPKYLQTDEGKEFFNVNVEAVLKKYGIKLYNTFTTQKASIVERFNRTLKSWMWKDFSEHGSYNWTEGLEKLLERYNTRKHRTIGLAPVEVNEKNAPEVLKRLMQKNLPPKKKNKFKVGDSVRISKYKHLFEKGYTPNWTTEIFVVDQVQRTRPVTYKLRDFENQLIQGGFYEEELQKTKFKDVFLVEKILKTKGDKVFVKWLGFDKKHNEWIDAENVL